MTSRLIPLHDRSGNVRAHAIVDAADFRWAGRWRWHMSSERYARRTLPRSRRKSYLHREILGLRLGDPRLGDHVSRNRLDCRRGNLRIVTKAQQQQNVSARRTGTSGYRGVYRKPSGRWAAQGRHDGRTIYLGLFDSRVEAARVAAADRREHLPFSHETLPPPKPRDPMASARRGTSRYRGVSWIGRVNRWVAYGARDGKRTHLGYFAREIDAANAAADWRARHS